MKKKTLRGWIPTTGMVLVMALNSFANGGINIPTLTTSSEVKGQCTQVDSGINIPTLVSGLMGMLVSDFVGINIPTLTYKIADGCKTEK